MYPLSGFLINCLEMGLSLNWKSAISPTGQGHAAMPGYFMWVPRTQTQLLKPEEQALLPTESSAKPLYVFLILKIADICPYLCFLLC